MSFNKHEKFLAVFDTHNTAEYFSLEEAIKQNPVYVVASWNEERHNSNYLRRYKIHNLSNPSIGFSKGLWRSKTEFNSDCAWSPSIIWYELIDPKGQIRRFSTDFQDPTIKIMNFLDKIVLYDSWKQYDLLQENIDLKETNARLKTEIAKLKL